MTIITITSGKYSSGDTVAEKLAQRLDARCVRDEVLAKAAEEFSIPQEDLDTVFEKNLSFWERLTESRKAYVALIRATLAQWAARDRLVYHGHGGQELLREVPHLLKVRLVYPIPERAKRLAEREGLLLDKAQKAIAKIDADRADRTVYLFDADWRDPTRYDLWINMGRVTAKQAEDLIFQLAQAPLFTLDKEREGLFQDFLVKCQVQSRLAKMFWGRMNLVEVEVRTGVVTLKGVLTLQEEAMENMLTTLKQTEGVNEIVNELYQGPVYSEWSF